MVTGTGALPAFLDFQSDQGHETIHPIPAEQGCSVTPWRKSRCEYATWTKAPGMGFPEGPGLTLRAGGESYDRELGTGNCDREAVMGREQGRKDEQFIHHSKKGPDAAAVNAVRRIVINGKWCLSLKRQGPCSNPNFQSDQLI